MNRRMISYVKDRISNKNNKLKFLDTKDILSAQGREAWVVILDKTLRCHYTLIQDNGQCNRMSEQDG